MKYIGCEKLHCKRTGSGWLLHKTVNRKLVVMLQLFLKINLGDAMKSY